MKQRLFWVLVLAVHAALWCKQVFLQHSLLQDSQEYLQAAHNLLKHGQWYSAEWQAPFKPELFSKRPPGYPSFLALIEALCGAQNTWFFALVYLLQNLISIGIIFKLTQWLKPAIQSLQTPYQYIALLPGLALPIYANFLMSETLLSACIFCIVYCSVKSPFKNKHWLIIIGASVLAMLIKPVFMPIAIGLPWVYIVLKKTPALKTLYLLSLLPIIVYFGLSKIHQAETGYKHYSSISKINLLHYNTYSLLLYKQGQHEADSIIDEIRHQAASQTTYAQQTEYIENNCKSILKNNLGTYSYLHLRGMALACLDPGKFDYTQILNLAHTENGLYNINTKGLKRSLWLYLNPLGTWLILVAISKLILLLWVLAYAFSKKTPLKEKIIWFIIPILVLGLTGPIGASRFLVPLLPIYYAIALKGYHYRRAFNT